MRENLVEWPVQFIMDCTWAVQSSGLSGEHIICEGGDSITGALEAFRCLEAFSHLRIVRSYFSINGYCKDIELADVGAKIQVRWTSRGETR